MSDIDKAAFRLRDSIDRRRKLSTVYTADVLALLAAHDALKLDTGKLGQQVEETAKAAGIQKTDNERLRKALQKVLDVGHNDGCMFCGFKDKAVLAAVRDDEGKP